MNMGKNCKDSLKVGGFEGWRVREFEVKAALLTFQPSNLQTFQPSNLQTLSNYFPVALVMEEVPKRFFTSSMALYSPAFFSASVNRLVWRASSVSSLNRTPKSLMG